MRSFKKHLREKLKNEQFRKLYEEERKLAELSLKVLDVREHLGLSQKEVARRAKVTQQQLSKLENGINCTMTTFLKVCTALGIKIDLEPTKIARNAA
jgi:DNA-binding XRE family transcriptional regulator